MKDRTSEVERVIQAIHSKCFEDPKLLTSIRANPVKVLRSFGLVDLDQIEAVWESPKARAIGIGLDG
jgi:hypothetical protein